MRLLRTHSTRSWQRLAGVTAALPLLVAGLLLLFSAIGRVVYEGNPTLAEVNADPGNVEAIAYLVFGRYVWLFEVTAGLLTVSGLSALVLPAITLGFFKLTLIMRLVRTEMLDVLRSDYIRFARARGLRNAALYGRHALRNTLIPVITIIGLQLGSLIAFAIVTETVFQWPGLGLLFITSIQGVDVPVISAYLLMIGLLYVGINLVVDLLYAWADPRLRRR